MTDTPRKSQRLKTKDRDKQALIRNLRARLSKESEEDEDMSILQMKQSIIPAEVENFNLKNCQRKRNNFLRVYNDYCTHDTSKYDGYDSKFIDDSVSSSYSSDEDVGKGLEVEQGENKVRLKKCVVSSGTDTEVGSPLLVNLDYKSEGTVKRDGERLERDKQGFIQNHGSDGDVIPPARKLKMSVLSSDESDSKSFLSSKSTPRLRRPSTRAIKVQARMKSDREKQFSNFRAKRNREESSRSGEKQPPVSSVPNFGDIKRLIDKENEVLPSAHQTLSRELFGDSEEDFSGEDDVCTSQYSSDYLEALGHTKSIVDSQSNSQSSPPQPVVYEFSAKNSPKDTTIVVTDSDNELEETIISCSILESGDDLSPSFILSTLSEYQEFNPDSTTDELKPTSSDCHPTLEILKPEDIKEDEKMLLADRYDIEEFTQCSPVDEGITETKTLQERVISSFTDIPI